MVQHPCSAHLARVIKGCENLGKYISCPLNVLSASPLFSVLFTRCSIVIN